MSGRQQCRIQKCREIRQPKYLEILGFFSPETPGSFGDFQRIKFFLMSNRFKSCAASTVTQRCLECTYTKKKLCARDSLV
jgi:hypothetical protein